MRADGGIQTPHHCMHWTNHPHQGQYQAAWRPVLSGGLCKHQLPCIMDNFLSFQMTSQGTIGERAGWHETILLEKVGLLNPTKRETLVDYFKVATKTCKRKEFLICQIIYVASLDIHLGYMCMHWCAFSIYSTRNTLSIFLQLEL